MVRQHRAKSYGKLPGDPTSDRLGRRTRCGRALRPNPKPRLPEERIRTDGTVDYLSQRATVKASQHPLRRGVPSCLPKAQGKRNFTSQDAFGARRPRACARRRVPALTTPALSHRRHFSETSSGGRRGFFLKGEATAQKKIPPSSSPQDLAALGTERPQTGKRGRGGGGRTPRLLRGLREKDRKPLWR